MAAVATEVFIAYAAPSGKTEGLCRVLIAGGKPLLTLDLAENARLLNLGAKPVAAGELAWRWAVKA